MDNIKKVRSVNFSEHEKNFLLKLIIERQNILGSTKTDALTSRKKAITWIHISEIHNAEFETCRTPRSIQGFWENFKKREAQKAKLAKKAPDPVQSLIDKDMNKRLKHQVIEKLENTSRIFGQKMDCERLKSVPSSSLNNCNGQSPYKQRHFFDAGSEDLESLLNDQEDDKLHAFISQSLHKIDGNSNSEDCSVNFSISSVDDSKRNKVQVKHVATSTEPFKTVSKQNEELHSLLLQEKKLKLEMLELDIRRKKAEMEMLELDVIKKKFELLIDYPENPYEK